MIRKIKEVPHGIGGGRQQMCAVQPGRPSGLPYLYADPARALHIACVHCLRMPTSVRVAATNEDKTNLTLRMAQTACLTAEPEWA